MGVKRKHLSSPTGMSVGKEEGAALQDTTSMLPFPRKRRRHQFRPLEQLALCHELYSTMRNCRDIRGRLLCEGFIQKPKRRINHEFYEVVSKPMDLLMIQHKLRAEDYQTVEELTSDVRLLVSNACTFYKEGSQEAQDARLLMDMYLARYNQLLAEGHSGHVVERERGREENVGDDEDADEEEGEDMNLVEEDEDEIEEEEEEDEDEDDEDEDVNRKENLEENSSGHSRRGALKEQLQQLFETVVSLSDSAGRLISELFHRLPSRQQYPDYYEVIKEPIDLKMIAHRIEAGSYCTIAEMARDVDLLVKNARTYNEPGSQVFKDAHVIRKMFMQKRAELEQSSGPVKSSLRIRNRRTAQGDRLSAITMSLQYGSESEDEQNSHEDVQDLGSGHHLEAESLMEGDGPLHQLLMALQSERDRQGRILCESFLRLPSRKDYPEYYMHIKQPISLLHVRSKLRAGQYKSIAALESDVMLMLENAKHFNMSSSTIFKRAVRLQHLFQLKKRELLHVVTQPHEREEEEEEEEEKEENEEDEEEEATSRASGMSTPASDSGSFRRKRIISRISLMGPGRRLLKPYKRRESESALRHHLRTLYNTVLEAAEPGTGRRLAELFMVKPSRKDYPDYYKIILEPVDMRTIDHFIRSDKYSSVEVMLDDFLLMFRNARHYNEEGSQVYNDALTLESLLTEKIKELGPVPPDEDEGSPKLKLGRKGGLSPKKSRSLTPLQQKLSDLYESVRGYTDRRGRKLSTIFLRLPSRSELPDYYLTIKRPMDLEKVRAHMAAGKYQDPDALVEDLVLMFHNACTYNDPDSLIYRDALVLHRELLQARAACGDTGHAVPNVRLLIHELIRNLFVSVLGHQDVDGRCYSDSLAEPAPSGPPEVHDNTQTLASLAVGSSTERQTCQTTDVSSSDVEDEDQAVLTLETVRHNVERGRYRRLDTFQEHMFEVFERTRQNNRTDSEIYEDAVELQQFFIKIRDELCKNGEMLLSPALSYTAKHLAHDLDVERRAKQPREHEDEHTEDRRSGEDGLRRTYSRDCSFRNSMYTVGDFVYVEASSSNMQPHIVSIEKLWEDDTGEKWLYGCWFYRPCETFHLATRKFLEKEVFKSDYYNTVPVRKILSKCVVMFVKEYFKLRPEGFSLEDVYVCASRYSTKVKAFKKIKLWTVPPCPVRLVPREESLPVVRVASIFAPPSREGGAQRDAPQESSREASMDEPDGFVEKDVEDVPVDVSNGEPGLQYYEQLNLGGQAYKVGDCVYLRTDGLSHPRIARIERLWMDKEGHVFFFGPVFIHPEETKHEPTKMFYRKEVFLSTIEDTFSMDRVLGKCCVLPLKDYLSCRPTEVSESDMFVCESRCNEAEGSIKRFKGLKRFSLSAKVLDDEIYYFRSCYISGMANCKNASTTNFKQKLL
uniref:Polybromo 1 n=1 Tax=Eptatretus burgeri TaxID=7764 RepID=A0A8C4QAN4_EPTBU